MINTEKRKIPHSDHPRDNACKQMSLLQFLPAELLCGCVSIADKKRVLGSNRIITARCWGCEVGSNLVAYQDEFNFRIPVVMPFCFFLSLWNK